MIVDLRHISLLLLLTGFLGITSTVGCSAGHRQNVISQQCQPIEHNTYIKTIRFSNDGKYLISQGDVDGQIIMWNHDAMQPEKVLVSPFGEFSDFEIDPDDSVVAYSRAADIYLYDYEKERDIGILKDKGNEITNIVISNSGEYLASDYGQIWKVEDKKEHTEIPFYNPLSFVPGENVIVFGLSNTLVFFDINTKEETRRVDVSSGAEIIPQALFTSDGKRGFSLSGNFHLSYFDVETGKVTTSFQVYRRHKIYAEKILLDEAKNRLYGIAMGYKGFAVSIFDLEKGDLLKTIKRSLPVPRDRDPNAGLNILDAVLSPDGKTLAVAGEDCMIQLFDIETLQPVGVLGEGCRVAPFKRPKIV